jgi:hypothetical protein
MLAAQSAWFFFFLHFRVHGTALTESARDTQNQIDLFRGDNLDSSDCLIDIFYNYLIARSSVFHHVGTTIHRETAPMANEVRHRSDYSDIDCGLHMLVL